MNKMAFFGGLVLLGCSTWALAFEADRQRFLQEQAQLDQACEAARQVLLAPTKAKIYQECMQRGHNDSPPGDCQAQSAGYNGNRFGGNPRYYDAPACVTAFEHARHKPDN